jgi:UDP-glucose 4-epimerase
MNCGYGHGASVREVISSVERVIGRPLPVKESPRRAGDPAWLVADARKIRDVLGWQPRFDDLDEIVRTAYTWEKRINAAG